MKNGYKIDFAKNTITVNYKFAAAMNEYGSTEYRIYKGLKRDILQQLLNLAENKPHRDITSDLHTRIWKSI